MASLWDKPSAHAATIAMSSEHGLPDFSGASYVNWNDTAYTLAEANRRKGIDIADAQKEAALETMNEYRRWLFHSLLVRWFRLLAITQGPLSTAYAAYEYFASDGEPNFTDKLECAASGSGTTVNITWTDSDWSPVSYLTPGLTYVADHGSGLWGMTQLVDVSYQGESGGTHTAILTLFAPLNANRESKVWFYRENYPREMPVFHLLREDRDICARCVEVEHDALKTHRQVYGTDGIDGNHYCTFLDWPGALIEGFTTECKQVSCPYYQRPRAIEMEPGKNFFSEFVLNPGRLLQQLTFPAPLTPAVYAARQYGYEGLFAMLGVPTYRHTDGLYLLTTTRLTNRVVCDTGETYPATSRNYGFPVFGDFETVEEFRREDGLLESDAIGLLAEIAPTHVQSDQTGGALVTTESRTPGADLERRMPRSIGYTITDPGDGLDAGEHRTYGYGFSGAQRPLAREYTSRPIVGPIAAGASGTNLDEETRITIVPESVSIGWVDPAAPLTAKTFSYRVKFEFPRFGDSVTNALTEKLKSVGAHAVKKGTLNATGNLLDLEFALGVWTAMRSSGAQSAPDEILYRAGANVVCPPLAWESRNPGSGAILGGRQARLFPGDAIEFTGDDSLVGVRGTVVAAEAYGGAWDDEANMPEGIPFLPEALLANYGYRDKCTIDLEGVSGRALQAAQQAGLFESGDVVVSKVGLLSVLPPSIDHNGAARSYPVAVSLITGNATIASLTEGTDYVLDRATGAVYLAEGVFAASGSHKVHVAGQVFCSQPMLPLEEAETLEEIIDTVESDGYLPLRMRHGTQAIALTMVRDSDSTVFDSWYWSLVAWRLGLTDEEMAATPAPSWDSAGTGGVAGRVNPFQVMATNDPSTAQWRKVTLTPGSDAILGSYFYNFSGSANAFGIQYANQGFAWAAWPIWNVRAADILSAVVPVDFEGAVAYSSEYTWNHESDPPVNDGTLTETESISLRMLGCIITTDEEDPNLIIAITPVAIDAATSLRIVEVPIDPYNLSAGSEKHLRGVMEITNIVQYICGHQHELSLNQEFYLLINGNEDMLSSSASPWFLVQSWVEEWTGQLANSGNVDENGVVSGSLATKWIRYSNLTVGDPIFKLVPGSLGAGPVPHIDESGLALIQIGD